MRKILLFLTITIFPLVAGKTCFENNPMEERKLKCSPAVSCKSSLIQDIAQSPLMMKKMMKKKKIDILKKIKKSPLFIVNLFSKGDPCDGVMHKKLQMTPDKKEYSPKKNKKLFDYHNVVACESFEAHRYGQPDNFLDEDPMVEISHISLAP